MVFGAGQVARQGCRSVIWHCLVSGPSCSDLSPQQPVEKEASSSMPGPGLGDLGCRGESDPIPLPGAPADADPGPSGEYLLQPRLLGCTAGCSQRQGSTALVHLRWQGLGCLISKYAQGAVLSCWHLAPAGPACHSKHESNTGNHGSGKCSLLRPEMHEGGQHSTVLEES